MSEARIDKWMWAVRIFKTRTIAAEACKKRTHQYQWRIRKAARTVKPGDIIQVRKPPVTYSFKVLQAIEKRIGAKATEMMENVTTPDQYELLEMSRISGFIDRAKGAGRPTKKRIDELWKSLQLLNSWMTLILNSILRKKKKRVIITLHHYERKED